MHVSGMASLTACFGVLIGKQWPQPMLIITVGFLRAGSRSTIALVTGRAPEFFGIMRLQQFRFGVAGEGASILVRPLLSFRHHYCRRNLKRFPRIHVAGFTSVDYVGLCHVDL